MQNIREKDVGATFAYDAAGNLSVAKMASYDRIGRKTRQWVIYTMPGMPAVELSYEYDQADELTHSAFGEWDGASFVPRAKRHRSYDAAGRLTKIEDENHKALATYEYTTNGNVKSKSYYDRGALVYKKTIVRDVHGRPRKIVYENGGKLLYQDTVGYVTPLAGRISEVEHTWKEIPNHGDEVRAATYEYDADGRLTKVDGALSGEYAYDGPYGQMTHKKEGDTTVNYTYFDRSKYRPTGFDVNGSSPSGAAEYFLYDAAGNVWLDRHAKVAYRLNSAGLPEAAYVLSAGAAEPTLDQVDAGGVANVDETMLMAYDEGGGRIWTALRGAGVDYEVATMPGVGTYEWIHIGAGATGFSLKRMDLVAGGFRDVKNDVAYFPVTDMQGNVRAYASAAGLRGAIDYYAYGTSHEIMHDNVNDEDNRRWQGKEEDEPIRKLYFGSRYFDPFFGMWLTPDPAGQFANPYTYGGDPVNYVDPNGEFVLTAIAIGAGIGALVGTISGSVQCTAPGGGSCGKTIGMNAGTGLAVGVVSGLSGGAFSGIAASIAGGALGGAAGGVTGQFISNMVDDNKNWYDGFGEAAWKGLLTGAVGGAAGFGAAQLMGQGALSAMTGGFAGGATGSAVNGEKDPWNILKGGLIGAGSALASYSATWAYGNYEGAEVPEFTPDGEPLVVPKQPDGSFEADGYLKQANKILVDARAEYAEANGLNADEIEAGASFKIKTKFWTGKKYLDHGKIGFGNKTSVEFASRQNDDFRYHLHPADGTQIDAISYASSRHPSPTDYMNVRGYAKYGISNYAAVNTPEGHAEVYHFTYTNKNPQYRISKW